MPVTVIVGAQWGDEGKGKIVDYLAESADIIIRFQGGPNAGHTIINQKGEFKLHGIPSGIFRQGSINIVGPGCVVSPSGILTEIDHLKANNAFQGRLMLSSRAHVIMPYHYDQEQIEEANLGKRKIGTTGKAVGPAYSDKHGRHGIRLGDLEYSDWLKHRLDTILSQKNRYLRSWNKTEYDPDTILNICSEWYSKLAEYITDTNSIINRSLNDGKSILLEGQLGAGKCIEWGCYPFVTSSSPTAGSVCTGAGIPPNKIDHIVGVVKAYSTSVGAGPMVTANETDIGPVLRKLGNEFGATTGRPRTCGWLDTVMLRHSTQINGFTSIAVTRLDILDTVDQIGVCTGYTFKGETIEHMPITPVLEQCKPQYKFLPGWKKPVRDIRKWDDLPVEAQKYLNFISDTLQTPISFVSVGPHRDETIVV